METEIIYFKAKISADKATFATKTQINMVRKKGTYVSRRTRTYKDKTKGTLVKSADRKIKV